MDYTQTRATGRSVRGISHPLSSVRSRIIFGFALLMAVLVVVVSTTAWMAWQHDRQLAQAEQDAQTVAHLKTARARGGDSYSLVQSYILTGDEGLIAQIRQAQSDAVAALNTAFALIESDADDAESTEALRELVLAAAPLATIYEGVVTQRRSGDVEGATGLLFTSTESLLLISDKYDALAGTQQEQATTMQGRADRTSTLTVVFVIASGAIGLIIGAFSALMVIRSIFRPLEELETAARAIGDGELEARAPETGPTEFACLGAGFNRMTEALLDASKRRELEAEREKAHRELELVHKELSATTERLDGVLSSIQDVVFSVDPNTFEVMYINEAVEAMFGRPAADFKNDPMLWLRMVLPEDGPRLATAAKQMTETSMSDVEYRIRRPDGTIRWLYGRSRLIRGDSGNPLRLDGTCTDVTESREAQEALRESEEHWRSLVQNASDVILILKQDSEIEYVSPAVKRTTGRLPEDITGLKALDRLHEDDRAGLASLIDDLLGGAEPRQIDFRVAHVNGKWRNLEATGALMSGVDGPRIILNVRDVTERREAQATITHMAYHDALTGLPNRALFRKRIETAIANADRDSAKVWVLSIDLDRFKIVNDTLGHSAGDELLKAAADRLSAIVREEDTLARLGGDEFELLVTECDSPSTVKHVAERIVDAFRKPFDIQGQSCRTTASIGISQYPDDGADTEAIMQTADIAMYAAKESGRDAFRQFEPGMNSRDADWLAIETDLRLALERDELAVYYQPQVSIQSGEIVGVEALVRWNHPERGLLMPNTFIPVAEETGLIAPLGEYVLRAALADLAGWEQEGGPPLRLSVNITYQQIAQTGFVDMIKRILEDTPEREGCLLLEITESAVLRDFGLLRRVAEELAAVDVRLSIDDFGTGNTTLRYLNAFPICELKIDMSFIRDLFVNQENAAIASAVIALGHSLGLSVLAEGVETKEQLEFLRERNCDEFQGFLHSRPMPASELRALLAPLDEAVVAVG